MKAEQQAHEILQLCEHLKKNGYELTYRGVSQLLSLDQSQIVATKGERGEIRIKIYAPDYVVSDIIRRLVNRGGN